MLRAPLTRERVLSTAVELADAHGIEAVTMRRLADELGVEAMSLYHHLPNKEAVLNGVVDLIMLEVAAAIERVEPVEPVEPVERVEPVETPWKAALRARILASRTVMLRHRWAPALIESRTAIGLPGAQHRDGIVRTMHEGGLTYDLIHHAMHALGSRSYGFVQEMDDSSGSSDLAPMAAMLPNLVAMLAEVSHDDPSSTLGWCDDQTEFEFGLDLLLDGLERRAAHP